MLRIGIAGYHGRMGSEIAIVIAGRSDMQLVGGVVRPGSETDDTPQGQIVVTDTRKLLPQVDVLIDFSVSEATADIARACGASGVALVSGVTGLSADQLARFKEAATSAPVFYATNLSVGIALMTEVVQELASKWPDADIEIVERHHRNKVDAPSGTALTLLEAIESGRGNEMEGRRVYGRQGVSPRQSGEIGVHSVRGGGNSGEHEVSFLLNGEELSIKHRSLSRSTFADGAVAAASWLVNQPAGLYGMSDLLRST